MAHSVQVVLKKIESAQLNRAKQEMAEKLQVILNSVNQALFHTWLSPATEEEDKINKDEAKLSSDQDERKKHSEMLSTILKSSLEKEYDLGVVLEWLKDATQELEEIQNYEEFLDSITEEWVEDLGVKIQMFMSDIQACIDRVHQLCSLLFDTKKKTKKKKEEISKGGVWRWWRESKVDAKTILKIQKLQPSSTDCILSDITLGSKTAKDLSFMLADMAKLLSCSKAMGMAFKFVQSGLHNLNDAFLEQSCQVQQLHKLLEQLKADDCQFELKDCKRRVDKLEGENCKLRKENAAYLLKIQQMQEALQQQLVLAPLVGKESVHYFVPQNQQAHHHHTSSTKPKITKSSLPSQMTNKNIEAPQIKEELPLELVEPKVDYVTYDSVSSPTPGNSSDNKALTGPVLEHFDTFEMKKKCSTQDDSFKKLDNKLHCQVSEIILERPSADSKLDQGRFLETARTAVDIPKEISWVIPKHKQDISKVNHNVQSLTGDKQARIMDESRQESSSTVMDVQIHTGNKKERKKDESRQDLFFAGLTGMDQVSNTSNMSKEETNMMHQALKNLMAIPTQMQTEQTDQKEQITEKIHHSLQDVPSYTSILSPDTIQEDEKDVSQLSQMSTKSRKFKGRMTRSVGLDAATQKPERNTSREKLPSETLLLSDSENMEHFKREIEIAGDTIARTLLKGTRYQMNHETQRTNLLLLQNAMRNSKIPVQLYKLAEELMRCIHDANLKCLALLLRKYMAFRALQQARYQLNTMLRFAHKHKHGLVMKEYYIILPKLDKYEEVVLGRWRTRQAEEEQKYRTNLARIIYMFNYLRNDYNLNLLNPWPCRSNSLGPQFLACEPHGTKWSVIPGQLSRPDLSTKTTNHLLTSRNNITPSARKVVREEVATLCKCSVTLNDVQLTRNLSVMPPPVPIIPRLLEMNTNKKNTGASKAMQDRIGGAPV